MIMELLEKYREKCPKCQSNNTNSWPTYHPPHYVLMECEKCGHRWRKVNKK